MRDSLWDGRSYRLPNVIDDDNRQVLHIGTDTSLPALRVIPVLGQLKETRGLPNMIRVDNGPEFISQKLDQWCKEHQITLAFIQPGKPTQNAYIERLNGSMRQELDRKSTRLNSSHVAISYAVFCLKKKIKKTIHRTN